MIELAVCRGAVRDPVKVEKEKEADKLCLIHQHKINGPSGGVYPYSIMLPNVRSVKEAFTENPQG